MVLRWCRSDRGLKQAPPALSRIKILYRISLAVALLVLPAEHSVARPPADERSHSGASLSAADSAFLEDLCHRAFLYFLKHSNRETGLVLDRARANGSPYDDDHRRVASIAATGFGLTAWCIAAQRGWVSRSEARSRVRAALRFFAERAVNEHGWFYHWMDAATGERMWNSEISSIDTALLMAGVLTARQCFKSDHEIVRLASAIYHRIDFKWMLNGDPLLLSHGWKPDSGFLVSRWDRYCELTILYLMAIGSPTHPIPPQAWYAWKRELTTYRGLSYVNGGPLFIHQYSQAWVDYRGLKEGRAPHLDYFANSLKASLAHRRFCIDLGSDFPGYSADVWGISASDSVKGYVAWGGPPRDPNIDGTVVPCAAAGSLMFTPEFSLSALRTMQRKFGDRVYGRYGFVDAFNPNTGWVDTDVIGIDLGITLLSAENLRSQGVWRWFMLNPEIRQSLKLAGFVRYRADYAATRREALGVLSSNRASVDSRSLDKYKAARMRAGLVGEMVFRPVCGYPVCS
jgi:hypothetical protein